MRYVVQLLSFHCAEVIFTKYHYKLCAVNFRRNYYFKNYQQRQKSVFLSPNPFISHGDESAFDPSFLIHFHIISRIYILFRVKMIFKFKRIR